MTLTDTYTAVQNWFQLTRLEIPLGWKDMIDQYRSLKGSGHNRYEILAALEQSNPILHPTKEQAAAMVNAMERVEAGIPIQDPNERPSWAEAWNEGPGKAAGKIPWGKIALFALAYFAVTQGLPSLLKK